ncbi:CheY-like chemotaxis protein [Bradyrhizobium barranii subsp. barranii]|uniref:response regulator n=1 Tax=Bradyrhizobium liaoningense TaxID=43992 RepID=UPI001BAD958C|nr:response regulator [Bradyrhizobium liaoningense]MBR0884032.1 response regulator [Bradyrhizobium liaoningense]
MKVFQDKLDTVLIIDDEPFNTEWLTDYFTARKFEVVHAEDLQSALNALEHIRYRYVVVDLSIPVSPVLAQPLASLGTEFFRYPGLMAARRARTTGHNSFQVIVYSVHDSNDVDSYTGLIDCRYILKGRPRELKEHVEATIHRKPPGWHKQLDPSARTVKPKQKPQPTAKRTPKKKIATGSKKKSFYVRYGVTPAQMKALAKGRKPQS